MPPEREVKTRAHLLQLHPGHPRAALLVLDRALAEHALRPGERGDDHDAVDALQVDPRRRAAAEDVDEDVLGQSQPGLGLEPVAQEDHARLAPGDGLVPRAGEVPQALVVRDEELDHVEQVVVEEAADGEAVGALLLVRSEDERPRVRLLREELEARLAAALERADAVVLARHLVHLALLHHPEVRHQVFQRLAALPAVEHEAHLPLRLHELGRALHERPLAQGRLRLLQDQVRRGRTGHGRVQIRLHRDDF